MNHVAAAPLSLSLHGVSLALESELATFRDYVRVAMGPYLCDADTRPMVRAKLVWVDGFASQALSEAFPGATWNERPDRDLYLDSDRATAYWLRIDDFPDLQMAISYRDGCLSVVGRYHFHVGRDARSESLRRLWYRGRLDLLRARRFSTLLYYLVYHPILWALSRRDGWSVLHGGAVADSRGSVVFGGMPGCGKSTLSVAMLADPRWTMLSDNLVLHRHASVRACPELLLLDDASLRRAGGGARHLEATGERRVYGRDAHRPSATVLEPVAPTAIFCVGRSRTTVLESVDPDEAAARLEAGNVLAKEVRRIRIMNEVIDLLAGTHGLDERAALRTLTRSAPCYALWLAQDSALDDAVAAVGRAAAGDRAAVQELG